MKTILLASALALCALPAAAADYALILNDQERAALVGVLDELTKAKGLAVAKTTLHLYNKVVSAPAVTEQKPPDDDAKPETEKEPRQ